MRSVSLIRLLDVVPPNRVREATGVSPRSILIEAEDLNSVTSVAMNGVTAPEFAVLSRTTLIAEVPAVLRDQTINDIAIFSTRFTFTERSLVEFTVGTRIATVQGTLRLMQLFLRILLRTPGSNRFHPETGGGLLSMVGGTNITRNTAADIQIALTRTKQQIVRYQAQVREVPPSERLLSAELGGISVDNSDGSVNFTVILTSHNGDRAGATVLT